MVQDRITTAAPHGEVEKTRFQSSTDADVQRCVVCGSKTYGPEKCSDPHPLTSTPQRAEDTKTLVDEGTERVGFEDVLSHHGSPHPVEEVELSALEDAAETGPAAVTAESEGGDEGGDDRPAKSARRDEWVDYRLAHGYTDDEVEGKTIAELQDLDDR